MKGAPSGALLSLALASAFAGAAHLALVGEHLEESVLLGAAFGVAGAAQLLLAALMVWRPGHNALRWSAVVNTASIAAWTISRSWGLPFGPEAGRPESISAVALSVKLAEAIGVALAVSVLRSSRLPAWRTDAIPLLTAAAMAGFTVADHHPAPAHMLESGVLVIAGTIFGLAVARRSPAWTRRRHTSRRAASAASS